MSLQISIEHFTLCCAISNYWEFHQLQISDSRTFHIALYTLIIVIFLDYLPIMMRVVECVGQSCQQSQGRGERTGPSRN